MEDSEFHLANITDWRLNLSTQESLMSVSVKLNANYSTYFRKMTPSSVHQWVRWQRWCCERSSVSQGRSPCRSMDSVIERMNRRGISTSSIQVNIEGRVANAAAHEFAWITECWNSQIAINGFCIMRSWQQPGYPGCTPWPGGRHESFVNWVIFSSYSEISRVSLCFVGLEPH